VDTLSVGQVLRAIIETAAVNRFGLAMWAYALSFALIAVSRGGTSFPGAYCAYVALLMLVNPIVNSRFFEPSASVFIPVWMIGWINIAFLASLAMRWWEGNRRPFKILRIITLLLIRSVGWSYTTSISIRAKDTSSGSWQWFSRSLPER